ncbi:MAG TPA: helix-turn-helix domain-containing protein [Bryobacteraceae bacterium]|nr:hypothetical protein [Bryobacterales bacterium]HRJ20412.1 helix-turn-helix domain-containing protein [Bryobacteraceae bacterium]
MKEPILTLEGTLSSKQAAALVGVPPRTLWRLRDSGRGPAYFRSGRTVHYRREDLLAWLRTARRETADSITLEAAL